MFDEGRRREEWDSQAGESIKKKNDLPIWRDSNGINGCDGWFISE